MSNGKADRNSINHKHCRIYDDKKLIPRTDVKNQFHNNFHIMELKDLDALLGDYSNSSKYIVVYKGIFSWLPSISNWANKCNWKNCDKMDFVEDYLHYIDKWDKIKNDRVLFVDYMDYLRFANGIDKIFLEKIEKFLNLEPKKKSIFLPQKVNCSSEFTKERYNYYFNKEYMKEYTDDEIMVIEDHPMY